MFKVERMPTAGPAGLSWQVVDAGGAVLAAAPTEGGADRIAFLLGTWKAGGAAAAPAAVPAPVERRAAEVLPLGVWSAEGAEVAEVEPGLYRVAFPVRPRVHLRDALKGAGFRWDSMAGAWFGRRLPLAFRPAAVPAGGVA